MPFAGIWLDFLMPVFIYGVAPLSLVIWVWQRRRRIGPETAGGAQISSQAGKSITLWVVLAMTGALVCLAIFLLVLQLKSPAIHFPQTSVPVHR